MPFTYDTGEYNVHGSFVVWLQGQLNSYVAPAVGAAVALNLDHPAQALQPPDISLHWLGCWDDPGMFAGAHVDGGKRGKRRWDMAEINVWVSRAATNWRMQKAQLTDTLNRAFSELLKSGGAILIYDFYTSSSTPQATSYTLHITEIAARSVPPDPNPDIERARLQVTIWWIERV